MSRQNLIIFLFLFKLLCPLPFHPSFQAEAAGGKWNLLVKSTGIVAMHMQLLHNDKVVILDRTDFGKSNILLPNGKCRRNPLELALKVDCTAHSVEYDVGKNAIRPLMVQSNVWCSSGTAMPDGSLIHTGGFNDGDKVVRQFQPCNGCDWKEIKNGLINRRWYATNHLLPEGRQVIIGGRNQFNLEFYPKAPGFDKAYALPFLAQTNDARQENNLYPFVFLNTDGNLFIFANNRAILYNYKTKAVVKNYPQIPGGDPRCYPSTGSAVLLPLKNLQNKVVQADVLVCGGAPKGGYISAVNGKFVGALKTCARMNINAPLPQWTMETMPLARVMGDMVTLPNGHVCIINGGAVGTAGYEMGRNPVLNPVIYKPDNQPGKRFEVQNPTKIPRMYHSSATLLGDGRVLVGGSNPRGTYQFKGVLFPTELSLEAFSPSYLDAGVAGLRPKIIFPASQVIIKYGQKFNIRFTLPGKLNINLIKVTMVSPSFSTHSFSMNQRSLVLISEKSSIAGKATYDIKAIAPGYANLAPPSYYLLFVVHQEIPSVGIWVKLQ
ncbi:hypothetical protein Leryth_010608 [Lithospermum erythrorhizon]|nr:hypothetical protein Leryth_010608 [Lithospermum erythrorhizon]